MDRRSFFRLFPMSLVGLAAPGHAEKKENPVVIQVNGPKPSTEPSPWVEFTCQGERFNYDTGEVDWRCGTKFKAVRGSHIYCPSCFRMHSVSPEEYRDKMTGIVI